MVLTVFTSSEALLHIKEGEFSHLKWFTFLSFIFLGSIFVASVCSFRIRIEEIRESVTDQSIPLWKTCLHIRSGCIDPVSANDYTLLGTSPRQEMSIGLLAIFTVRDLYEYVLVPLVMTKLFFADSTSFFHKIFICLFALGLINIIVKVFLLSLTWIVTTYRVSDRPNPYVIRIN